MLFPVLLGASALGTVPVNSLSTEEWPPIDKCAREGSTSVTTQETVHGQPGIMMAAPLGMQP